MSTRTLRPAFQVLVAAITIAMAAGVSAAPSPADHPAMSKETRQKMATLHEQMAACLRSDKPLSECRAEMAKNCRDMMGEHGCPMVGTGMRNDHMMKDQSQDSRK